MSLEAIAKAYTTCVDLEERARNEALSLAEDLAVQRADLHALLMDALRHAGIPFGGPRYRRPYCLRHCSRQETNRLNPF